MLKVRKASEEILALREVLLENLKQHKKPAAISAKQMYETYSNVKEKAPDTNMVSRELSHMYHQRNDIGRVKLDPNADRVRFAYHIKKATVRPIRASKLKEHAPAGAKTLSRLEEITQLIGDRKVTASQLSAERPDLGTSTKISNTLGYGWRSKKLKRAENAGDTNDHFVYFNTPTTLKKLAKKAAVPAVTTAKATRQTAPKVQNKRSVDIDATKDGVVTVTAGEMIINIKTR